MDKIKIFYDGLDFKQDKLIQGYTTNPTLLKKINKPFEESIKKFILQYPNYPLSVEVTNDDQSAIIEEANKILDVENVIASILLVDNLRIQKN